MFDDNKTGIVIDKYPSIAVVVKVLRKYTDDSIITQDIHLSVQFPDDMFLPTPERIDLYPFDIVSVLCHRFQLII